MPLVLTSIKIIVDPANVVSQINYTQNYLSEKNDDANDDGAENQDNTKIFIFWILIYQNIYISFIIIILLKQIVQYFFDFEAFGKKWSDNWISYRPIFKIIELLISRLTIIELKDENLGIYAFWKP